MPSPIPITRLLPRDFGFELGARSSPLRRHAAPHVPGPAPVSRGPLARRLWSSAVQWRELRALEPVGSGGFGRVFRGTYFGETVAVKHVRRAKNKLASRQSFWAELNAAHLRHENLVRVIAATTLTPPAALARSEQQEQGQEEEEARVGTIVMEFAGELSLHSVIYDGAEPLPGARGLRYAADIARALAHLHAHGVVHLDVKPANVLLARDGTCKLADFGCSLRLDGGSARAAQIGGTFTHRAPELLRGGRVTARADVYSFGVTLWQLLTRDPPYREERQHVIYAVVAYGLRPELEREEFRDPFGRACRDLLRRCWPAEPDLRPRARDLLTELQTLSEIGS